MDEEKEIEVPDLDQEESTVEDSGSELEAMKRERDELLSKNQELFGRIKKLEKKPDTNKLPRGEDDWRKETDFIVREGRDLDADEVSEVIAYAKGKNIGYTEALKTPVIQSYLKERKAEKRVANATPGTSKSSFVSNGKDWRQMSTDERKSNFSAYIASRARR